jgi:hypothetical protein
LRLKKFSRVKTNGDETNNPPRLSRSCKPLREEIQPRPEKCWQAGQGIIFEIARMIELLQSPKTFRFAKIL